MIDRCFFGVIPALNFIGRQNSGKTTLLEKLIAELCSRGLRVGTVKHHSHAGFEMDVAGKDSWRHVQAGSRYTVVAAPDKIGSVRQLTGELPVEQILAEMSAAARDASGAPTLDVVLVEGYRSSSLPSVELVRAANPADAARSLDLSGARCVAVVTDIERIAVQAAQAGLPTFGFEQIAALADFIAASLKESAF
ncbi:MAG: molybdopterin-guanine dinucleotide biosynthesis protein B [Actinomycetia bacterium]|nr:molybdopterin-guanine dinucleotide biosynthesis protein B [Actinomycetes bacterium]